MAKVPQRSKRQVARDDEVVRAMHQPMPTLGLYRGPDGSWHIGEQNGRACRLLGRVWSQHDGKAILESFGRRIKAASRKRRR
jgi:hypothetical protein